MSSRWARCSVASDSILYVLRLIILGAEYDETVIYFVVVMAQSVIPFADLVFQCNVVSLLTVLFSHLG